LAPAGLVIKYPQIESMSARPVRTGNAIRLSSRVERGRVTGTLRE
jgi:hypothetical protein